MPKTLLVSYDVSDWTDDQIDALTIEAVVQAERSDGHPSTTVTSTVSEA
jgi:hypothetical protein